MRRFSRWACGSTTLWSGLCPTPPYGFGPAAVGNLKKRSPFLATHMGAQTTQKRISLVVPTYNERKKIRLLVEQLFTVAEKSNLDLELVIVDDNSPDGTGEAVNAL